MIIFKLLFIALVATGGYLYITTNNQVKNISNTISVSELVASTTNAGKVVKSLIKKNEGEPLMNVPESKLITGLSHVNQTFNNCSSVALMINLSRWGIVDTQEKIKEATRPWNNANGNNDDKSVNLFELALYASSTYGLVTYVRPNGDIDLLKKFVANDIPVLTRTLMYPKDDIVHYRVIHGYDEKRKIVVESDGVGGKDVPYSYDDWMHLWKDFNYEYLIIVPTKKKQLVEKILGDDLNEEIAWGKAKERAQKELSVNSGDLRANYNLITALYYLHDYENVISEFEKIESKLTRRKLWYQHEPIYAYFNVGNNERVIKMVDYIENDNNKSISELYILKGKILEKRGDKGSARKEYEKAVYYNKNLIEANESLSSLQ
jgi:SUMO ligase MMS21 Smc5/6 complex component